jgi:UDP-N-acetylglucosamine--N-acetylmuramyl-(pentapeptide) pyrophosphoryl-undecaprenol N-acetylglucosamine transferase
MRAIRRVLLTGGGTAGHVNPALAIGSALRSDETEFLYVGVRGRVEEEIVPREGIPIEFVRAGAYPDGSPLKIAGFAANLAIGVCKAAFILKRFRPDVIVGTGSYVAAPVLIAAAILKKIGLLKSRVFLHEQNAVPGKLNKVMARFADRVLVTFEETLNCFREKSELVGYPLRRRIEAVPRNEALRRVDFTIADGCRVVFAFGGSQGSRVINRALVDALEYLVPYRGKIYVIHGVGLYKSPEYDAAADTDERLRRRYGAAQLKDMESFYVWRPYFYDIQNLYSVSDLVIARGGAGSLNEISAMGLPAIIIPKSILPGGHQVLNARAMERAGCAEVLYEQMSRSDGRFTEYIDGKVLADKIVSLAFDNERLAQMRLRSHSFLTRDAISRISAVISAETPRNAGRRNARVSSSPPAPAGDSPVGNQTLLARLEKEYANNPGSYKVSSVIARTDDIEYYKNRADVLLTAPEWQKRNLGVKLLGLLDACEKIPTLLALFGEHRRVSHLKRFFGGDFEQVGFIRRNIVIALTRLNTLTPEVESALLAGFRDPYYEVRAECAKAAYHFNERIAAREAFIAELMSVLRESNLDVSTAAAEALGRLGGEHDALPALLDLRDTKYWRLRTAALRGIFHLVKRGCVEDLETAESRVSQFILTSTDFRPHFEIKSTYRVLLENISRKKEANPPQ